jgi:hypothetical protein
MPTPQTIISFLPQIGLHHCHPLHCDTRIMTVPFLIRLAIHCLLSAAAAAAASAQKNDILSGLSEEFIREVRTRSLEASHHRQLHGGKKGGSQDHCKKVLTVFLDQGLVDANQFTEVITGNPPRVFDRQGGVVPIGDADAEDPTAIVGDYSYLITFTSPAFGCLANGAYTFHTGADQITFAASCSGLPFFTITGGRGKYEGAEGFVQFMIPVEGGNNHELYLC